MEITLLHDHFDADHLDQVKSQMSELGPPTIRVMYDEIYDRYIALEGSHRLRAAHALDLTPVLETMDLDQYWDVEVSNSGLGFDLDLTGVTFGDLFESSTNNEYLIFN